MLTWAEPRVVDELERIVREIDRSEMRFAGLARHDRGRVGRRLVALHIELVAVLNELDATDDASLIERRARQLAQAFRDRAYSVLEGCDLGYGPSWS
jgi:hypothetical protein